MPRKLKPIAAANLPLADLMQDYTDHLRQGNRSEDTTKQYRWALSSLIAWLESEGHPAELRAVTSRLLGEWQIHLLTQPSERYGRMRSAATVDAVHRAIHAFFQWAFGAGHISANPMKTVQRPKTQRKPLDIIPDDWARRLFDACEGTRFEDVRDMAMLRLLWDSGGRRREVANLRTENVRFESLVALVTGKGNKIRAIPFTSETKRILKKYLTYQRPRHPDADAPELWLGANGPMRASGLRYVLDRRLRLAGLPHLHPHQFRATMAARYLARGGSRTGLMLLMGWETEQMVPYYVQAVETDLALAEYRRIGMDDV